ncbi:MAG: DNA-binding protein [Tardiphaga sp.]|jgi:predicted nucleic acid-binding protein|nr:DNA-binding protein [Tardiphaga sp.]
MTLVDSNVLLDLFGDDPAWKSWSRRQLDRAVLNGSLIINDVIYAEISVRFRQPAVLDTTLRDMPVHVAVMPRSALFIAGKAFITYRTAGGARTGVLPDFFIGAHAAVLDIPILTRDTKRYRTYFPSVTLIAPEPGR